MFPVAAVQNGYSLWARDAETEVLSTCEELGVGFVPWSPLGQGFLTGKVRTGQSFEKSDVRSWFPRFTPEAMAANQPFIDLLGRIARRHEATPAQIALNWVINIHGEKLVAIAGASRPEHALINAAAMNFDLREADIDYLDRVSRQYAGLVE